MAGIKGKGGARGRSGRKSKAEEMGLQALLDKCWTQADREACIRTLARQAKSPLNDSYMDAVKLLMAYCFGKPKETHEHGGRDGQPIQHKLIVEILNGGSGADNKNPDE